MDYLHPNPCSSQIWTLPAFELGTAASWPQLLAGPPPCASATALPDTAPQKQKGLSEICSPLKPYIGANSDPAEDLPTGLKTSRAQP